MKKRLIGLTFAIALVLALCMPVAARYMHCPYCWDGKILTKTESTTIGTIQCDLDPSKTDDIVLYEKIEYCNNCDYEAVLDSYEEVYCRH